MTTSLSVNLSGLGAALARRWHNQPSDRELLLRFAQTQDGDAFALLLHRHGPMVLGVARRVLGDYQTAEDVFQATFLTLARKAATIRRAESLPGWLHGVTFRHALRARRTSQRRQRREAAVRPPDPPTPLAQLTALELLSILDQELQALPERFRTPLVLCCLEGLGQAEAARHLCCSPGSIKGRLERGRALLRQRLEKRGLTLPVALAGALMVGRSAVALPPALVRTTLDAALARASATPAVAALAQATTHALSRGAARGIGALVLVVMLVGLGVGVRALQSGAAPGPATSTSPALSGKGVSAEADKRVDRHGDPLPAGAVLRLGTIQRRAIGATLAMSPDGKEIIGVRGGKYLHSWDAATGKLRATRDLPIESRNSWLSRDGRWLVTEGPGSGNLAVWDVPSARRIHKLAIREVRYIWPVAFSPDGKRVAAVGQGQGKHLVRAWDLATGKEVFATEVRDNVSSGLLSFTPDSKRLLATFTSSTEGMYCWNLADGSLVWQNREFCPQSIAFIPDGKLLSTQERYPAVDLATGKAVQVAGLPQLTWDTHLTTAPDGRTLLLSSAEGVRVWDLTKGKELRSLAGAGEEVVVAPDGKSILTNNGALQRWDLATGKPLYPDNFEQGHIGEVTAIAFSADGKRLVSGSGDGSVRLWDVTTGKPLRVWRAHEARRPVRLWRWIKAGVTAVDISPDGRWVLSAGSEQRLRLWDAASDKEMLTLPLSERERGEDERLIYHVRISPDGKTGVALFGAEGFSFSTNEPPIEHTQKLATWDLRTGKLLSRHPVPLGRATALAPGGWTLLAAPALLDSASGKTMANLEGGQPNTGSRMPFVFSRDGAVVAGCCDKLLLKDGKPHTIINDGLRIWETASGRTVTHLKDARPGRQLVFHPSGRFVVASDFDGIRIWDVLTGKVVATRALPERLFSTSTHGPVSNHLAFAPNGRHLAIGQHDGTILLWDLPLPPLPRTSLTAKEMDSLWADLADADAARGWRAVWRLASDPDTASRLRERLKPAGHAPADATRRWLANLESKSFERRQEAETRLKELGEPARKALREALRAKPSLETARRLERILKAIEEPRAPTSEALRELRAIAVLERIGTQAAQRVLTSLAEESASVRLTREASAALQRLRSSSAGMGQAARP
jgi:RNA polymerase sigma factor (sigma-70 family)